VCIFVLNIAVYNHNNNNNNNHHHHNIATITTTTNNNDNNKKKELLKIRIIPFLLLHSSLPQFSDLWHLVLLLSRDKFRTVFVAPKNKFAVYMYFTLFLRQFFKSKNSNTRSFYVIIGSTYAHF